MPWATKKLGEICEFIFGYPFPANLFNKDGRGLPVVKTGDIRNNFCEYFYSGNYDKKYLVKLGDILIGLSGTIVSGRWQGKSALLNQRVVKLTNFNFSVDKNFIFYTLPIALKRLEGLLWKAAVKNVLKHHLDDLQILLPSLVEQKKIVYVLDSIQEAVRTQDEIIDKTKELKKAMMKKLFTEGIRSEGLKETEIGKIPRSWGVVRLGDTNIFEIKLGGTPSTRKPEFWNGNVSWITPDDLGKISSQYIHKTERTITEKGLKKGSTLLPIGEIILSTRAPIGYIAVLGRDMAFNQGCKGIQIKDKNKVQNLYLYYFLVTQSIRLRELGSGSTFRELSKNDLKKFLIPLPTREEQCKISEILQTIDQKTEIEQKKKVLYGELFRVMLNKLMNREIKIDKLKI